MPGQRASVSMIRTVEEIIPYLSEATIVCRPVRDGTGVCHRSTGRRRFLHPICPPYGAETTMRWTYQKRFHRQVAIRGSNRSTGRGTDISYAGSYLTFANRIHHCPTMMSSQPFRPCLYPTGIVAQTSFRPKPSLRVRTTDGNVVPIRTFWLFWTAS